MLDTIVGQPTPVSVLQQALASDRLAHTYLFEGPTGVGKQKTALALAMATLCEQKAGNGCGACAHCSRILHGAHPDVRVFSPRSEGAGNLKVEFVREEILPLARYAPFEGKAAFLIFPDADRSFPPHQNEAANSLLKTLEEPRPRVHFILLSGRPDRLLPTIRSRCQRVRFGRLSAHVLHQLLTEAGVPAQAQSAAVALADGRADRALWLAHEDRAQTLLAHARRIQETVQSGQASLLLQLADELAQVEDLPLHLEALAWLYRDLAVAEVRAAQIPSADAAHVSASADATGATSHTRAPDVQPLLEKIGEIKRAMRVLERPANPQLVLESLLFQLRQA